MRQTQNQDRKGFFPPFRPRHYDVIIEAGVFVHSIAEEMQPTRKFFNLPSPYVYGNPRPKFVRARHRFVWYLYLPVEGRLRLGFRVKIDTRRTAGTAGGFSRNISQSEPRFLLDSVGGFIQIPTTY